MTIASKQVILFGHGNCHGEAAAALKLVFSFGWLALGDSNSSKEVRVRFAENRTQANQLVLLWHWLLLQLTSYSIPFRRLALGDSKAVHAHCTKAIVGLLALVTKPQNRLQNNQMSFTATPINQSLFFLLPRDLSVSGNWLARVWQFVGSLCG